jgi:transposase-like protein
MKRKVNSYMDDFKLKVVQEYLRTNATVSEIQKKFGTGCRMSRSKWVYTKKRGNQFLIKNINPFPD